MIELLAPAGSREALTAAVESGADAVYLGGKAFGARQYAPNFGDDELAEVVRFAHLHGVRIFVTVNTLIDDSEIAELIEYLRTLYKIGVDAVIVQDVGVAKIAREVIPHMPLHASTQMTVHNLAGVKYLEELGFNRVVLARELSLSDIKYICDNSNVEIEAFIHGALCVCYSGQCLMSSLIGGRSGNRGRCAQPCRLPYTLVNHKGQDVLEGIDAGEYLLSPRDLNILEVLPDFINAGVMSFKIEGRMKRPEYVAVVVDTYRRAIDAYLADKNSYSVHEQDQKDLAQIFNRDFTTAYLEGKQGRFMMSDRRPNNRGVRIGRVLDYNGRNKSVQIKLDEPLRVDDILEFWVKVGGRVNVTVKEMTVNGESVSEASAGAKVTLPMPNMVRTNDRVFKVFDAKLMERARQAFATSNQLRRIGIDMAVTVQEGKPLMIAIQDANGFSGQGMTEFKAQPAIKRPLTEDTITKQVSRLGNTVFELQHLTCNIDGELMVPVSEINEARRKAIESLEQARLAIFERPQLSKPERSIQVTVPKSTGKLKGKSLLGVNVDSIEKVAAALKGGADYILFGGECYNRQSPNVQEYQKALNMVKEAGKKIIFATGRIIKEWQVPSLQEELALINELRPDGVSIANIGTIYLARQRLQGIPLYGDYPLNIYNSVAAEFYHRQGLSGITLSPELSMNQLGHFVGLEDLEVECLVHGYVEMMISEYCVLGSYIGNLTEGCSKPCQAGQYFLKDRKDAEFPVVTDQFCRMHILNSKELSMIPHVHTLHKMGIHRLRIEGKYGSNEHIYRLTKLYRDLIDLGAAHPLVQNGDFSTVEQDITRGHYFRGVL